MNARGKLSEAVQGLTEAKRDLAHAWSMRRDEGAHAGCLMSTLAEIQAAIDNIEDAVSELPGKDGAS